MISKLEEKSKAIELRKEGLSYSEILRKIPVAKSSLSLWLHSVGLSKSQKQRLTEKKLASMKRGSEARRKRRIEETEKIYQVADREIETISQRELWLMGTMLYWGEGQKQKSWNTGVGVKFSNSDPRMIKLFIVWLKNICKIPIEDIGFEIYIHKNSSNRVEDAQRYWSKILELPLGLFQTIYFKKGKLATKRHNIGRAYYGLLRVIVKQSTNLNRRIEGWIRGIDSRLNKIAG